MISCQIVNQTICGLDPNRERHQQQHGKVIDGELDKLCVTISSIIFLPERNPGDLKTRKSTGTSCQIKSLFRPKLPNFSRNIIDFVSKFLANFYFS